MAISKQLTEHEKRLAADAAEKIRQMCQQALDTGHPYAAVQLAKHGQFFARLVYRKGQVGYDMFQKYLR